MIRKALKAKKCKSCPAKFVPRTGMQIVCSPQCAILWSRSKSEAVQRKKDKRRKHELKTKSQWLKEAQRAFNKFIHLRDWLDPCISCGRHHKGQYHCGHFLSVASRGDLRFSEQNAHKQCSACNNFLSGNQLQYRKRLIKKIGEKAVEELEYYGPALNLIVPDIEAIKKKYREKANELQKKIKDSL